MPSVIFDKIPLPNIKVYTTVSLLLVSCCIYYSIKSTNDPLWRMHGNFSESISILELHHHQQQLQQQNLISNEEEHRQDTKTTSFESNSNVNILNEQQFIKNETRSIMVHLKDVFSFMSQEPVCIWTLVNMAYCCLILVGKLIEKIVFGDLRISEQQRMKDKFWNFIFNKFIFIFGVINVQYMNEVIWWMAWFSILGFFHLLSHLSKDRFEYLSFSTTTPGWSHVRLACLMITIFIASIIMIFTAIGFGLFAGLNVFAFMSAECFLLAIRTGHVLLKYGMFLYDLRQRNISDDTSWDQRGQYSYYTELISEIVALIIDFSHHLHMLIWSNIFLSMASLVIIMQLRCLAKEIHRKFKKHRNYLLVQSQMEQSYPLASQNDLTQNSDNCAICWEKMESARKLPCGHLFHNSCLQSWLEQDTSCPTCRLGLTLQNPPLQRHEMERIDENETNTRGNNHFFHFNGSRYVSWLPNFSVEVSNLNTVLHPEPATIITSQIRNMAGQIQEMFPNYPLSTLITDLQTSRSIEFTINNILEGRLSIPSHSSGLDDRNGFQQFLSNSIIARNNPQIYEINNMARQLQDMFPNFPLLTLINDLETSRSVEVTVNNILEGRLINPSRSSDLNDGQIFNNIPSTSQQIIDNQQDTTTLTNNSSIRDSSVDYGYEIERISNIFGNQNDLLKDENVESVTTGDRFSKNSSEREKILLRRKDLLVALARRRYFEKNKSELNIPTANELRNLKKSNSKN